MSTPNDASHDRRNFWQEAWDELPEESRRCLEPLATSTGPKYTPKSDIDEIIRVAEKQREEYQSNHGKFKFGSREWNIQSSMYRIINWVQRFKELGDILVSMDPVHAAPPWAAFRFVLQSAIASHEKMESIVAILALVSRLVQHGNVLEEVYMTAVTDKPIGQSTARNFNKRLVDLYVKILESLNYCHLEFNKSKARRAASAIFKPDEPENVLRGLEDTWGILQEHAHDNDRLQMSQISVELRRQLPDVLKNVSQLLVKMDGEEYNKVISNISKIKFGSQHKSVHDRRTANTGEWILKSEEFQQWRASETAAITILYGSPGAGKTFLVSRVIDHIIERQHDCSKANQGLAYFYCDRNDNERRQPQNILRSLVRQFASPLGRPGEMHQDLLNLVRDLQLRGLDLDVKICQQLLVTLISSYQSPVIVLDALDECDSETRNELMDCFRILVQKSLNVKVFISSRKDYDIEDHFHSYPTIMIQATDNRHDIEAFVYERLSRDNRWKNQRSELQEEIIKTLFTKSNGMFQWAALQVEQILRLKSWDEAAIQCCLAAMPKTLDKAYDQIWSMINEQNSTDRELALRAIQWVLCAKRPLRSDELAAAIRINPYTNDLYDIKNIPTEKAISGVCYNLLIPDEELGGNWRFCHLSAAEYVESNNRLMSGRNYSLASSCLKSLIHWGNIDTQFPEFSSYTQGNWHFHLQTEYDKQSSQYVHLRHQVRGFLGSNNQSSNAYQHWADARKSTLPFPRKDHLEPSLSPIFGVVILGLEQILTDWCEDDENLELNVCNSHGFSLLGLAALYGHAEICRFLIQKQVKIDRGHKSPLRLAADVVEQDAACDRVQSRVEVARLLLQNGADPNLRLNGRSVLDDALPRPRHMGRLNRDTISLLVENGATFEKAQQSLLNAAQHGYLELFKPCVDLGANINKYSRAWPCGTPLVVAARGGHPEAVKVLLELGADVNAACRHTTALSEAATYGRSNVMQVLLQAGADPNRPRGKGPLYRAAGGFNTLAAKKESIHILLDAGAKINATSLMSPVCAAMNRVHDEKTMDNAIEMVKFLFAAGADPNDLGSPLAAAAAVDNRVHSSRLILLLRNAGADPNHSDAFKNCLHVAAAKRYPFSGETTFTRLLEIGADPRLAFKHGCGSALAAAAFRGNYNACKLLLKPELGVNVNAQLHGYFKNALFAALAYKPRYGHPSRRNVIPRTLRVLFEAGADVLMPICSTLPANIATIQLHKAQYSIIDTKAVSPHTKSTIASPFSRGWVRIMWEFASSPMPRPPLSSVLQRCAFPSSTLPEAIIILKLASQSEPRYIQYAAILITQASLDCFILVDQTRSFVSLSQHQQAIASTLLPPQGEPVRTNGSCDAALPSVSVAATRPISFLKDWNVALACFACIAVFFIARNIMDIPPVFLSLFTFML